MNKSFTSLVLEAGGHEKFSYLEKDCRNHMDKVHHLKLEKGDTTAIGQITKCIWANARSRAAFKEFGDVVTFDMTYLQNKYDMPFTPFIGVNIMDSQHY
ncbi:hypothetical protein ACSBR2_003950 [Camellia fascicularis]